MQEYFMIICRENIVREKEMVMVILKTILANNPTMN